MKIGIVCDNYKLDKFKRELSQAGFKFKTFPFTDDTTTIKIETEAAKSMKVKEICEGIEAFFKASHAN